VKRALPALLAALLAASCTSHKPHRVTDLGSLRVYYTKHLRRGLTTGKLYFVDARTGEEVTIGSSAVLEITEEEFAREVDVKHPAKEVSR
jgi:hypothetical protein